MSEIPEYDVLLVGAGFGSVVTYTRLRKLGLKCRIFEREWRSGGVWVPNNYPGARVDSDAPLYQLFDKEIWEDFSFHERYPDRNELCRYFDHIDSKIHFSEVTEYNKDVKSARFDDKSNKWTIECADGSRARARWFIPAIGFAAKAYIPKMEGMEDFKGIMHHTAQWPQDGVDLKNKRIAVIGTGASGIQVIQECSKHAKQLTSYQRTPNMCLPMCQEDLPADTDAKRKTDGVYDQAFSGCLDTFAGFNFDFVEKKTFDDDAEERSAFFKKLMYEKGGFRYWLATYPDIYTDETANYEAYKYWRDTVRKRIDDPRKRDILAPMEPPHPFGTKRPSLEQHYYECFNNDHVDVLNIESDPIDRITPTGIRLKSGDEREFDVIVLATGFDAVTGSLAQLDFRNHKDESISDHWADGLKTSIGIALAGFPNMFFLYGPQAPTAFSNGPTTVQVQAKWLDKVFQRVVADKIERFDATPEWEADWTNEVHKEWDKRLFKLAKSWYQGSNIPGKRVEPLNYTGGMPLYIKALDNSLENSYQGWQVVTAQ